MQKMSQTIIEVANTHGGSYEYMISLINEFESIQPSGMKFQPFKYDRIAVKKYKGYELYKKLFFNRNQWKEIIKIANETKEVWLDVFDAYGIDIFAANIDSIYGLKLQTSVLDNITVLEALKGLELNDKKITTKNLSENLNFINNKSLNQIKLAQKNAFIECLKKKKIAFREFIIRDFSEQSLGELFSFFVLETILLGRIMKVNPFDQPSVELIKTETSKILN